MGSGPFTVLGGQGGAGVYIIAKNIVFNGMIRLNGGNGGYGQNSSGVKKGRSAGGGGGSCILRTQNILSNTGVFESTGGQMSGGGFSCNPKGGNGAMLIIAD